jgi:hypothetical protein
MQRFHMKTLYIKSICISTEWPSDAHRSRRRLEYRQANDGKLTKNEKRQLNRELNRSSRQIYRARHNNKTPKS